MSVNDWIRKWRAHRPGADQAGRDTQLRPTPINADQLTETYRGNTRVFATEASSLPNPGRVFDDAGDVGYTLIFGNTGEEAVVVEYEVVRDDEGDVMFRTYLPLDESVMVALRVNND
jgi:hypothetical protein